MGNGFITGNPDFDKFFDLNYELRYVDEFRDLIEEVGMERAGQILWAIYLLEDPESKLYNLPIELREQAVNENFLKERSFNWTENKYLVEAYRRTTMSKKKRYYAEYLEMMDERNAYLKTLTYQEDPELKDKLIVASKKVWDELAKIEAEYIKEQDGGNKVFGDREESASEKGLL